MSDALKVLLGSPLVKLGLQQREAARQEKVSASAYNKEKRRERREVSLDAMSDAEKLMLLPSLLTDATSASASTATFAGAA